jgi:hypothetical protein
MLLFHRGPKIRSSYLYSYNRRLVERHSDKDICEVSEQVWIIYNMYLFRFEEKKSRYNDNHIPFVIRNCFDSYTRQQNIHMNVGALHRDILST